jgi:YVTN family beta-propeller protein
MSSDTTTERAVPGRWIAAGAALVILAALLVGAPVAQAADPDGRLLVANAGDDTVTVYDQPANTLAATVPVGKTPRGLAVSPDGRKAWVANHGDGTLSVIDLRSLKVIKTIRQGQLEKPRSLALTPDGRRLLVTSEGSRRILQIDALKDVVERSTTTAQPDPRAVALARGGSRAWVAHRGGDALTILDVPALKTLKTLKVGAAPEGVALSPNERFMLATLGDAGMVAVIDIARLTVATRLPAGQKPGAIVFRPRSTMALVANRGSDDVTALDVASRQVVATVPVGRQPVALAINDRATRAYVANAGSNSVSVIALPGLEVTATIAAGNAPSAVAYAPMPAPPSKSGGAAKKTPS